MKRIISLLLCFAIVCPFGGVFAAEAKSGESRAVIGANLSEEQIGQVYSSFGVERGTVKELSVTNSEERTYLEGLVDESLIGTNSISCVYIEMLEPEEGLQIEAHNISWCTEEMYINALVTAGIDDAKIIVAAPFAVSGTAALTGVYKAYEDITGEEINEESKVVSTQELVITSELADEIGSYDAVEIVNEIKLILDETVNMTDEELAEEIRAIAAEYDITLVDSQIDQLIDLCRALEKLSTDELREKVEYVQETIKKLAKAKEKVSGITDKVKDIVQAVVDFFSNLFSAFKRN